MWCKGNPFEQSFMTPCFFVTIYMLISLCVCVCVCVFLMLLMIFDWCSSIYQKDLESMASNMPGCHQGGYALYKLMIEAAKAA